MDDQDTKMEVDYDDDYTLDAVPPVSGGDEAQAQTDPHVDSKAEADVPDLMQLKPLESQSTTEGIGAGGEGGDLASRLSKHKVYLLEESGALIHSGSGSTKDFPEVDLSFLETASKSDAPPIRDNALHISGPPLAHIPTSKVFSYVTLFGPKPLGVEWINDTSLVVIFSSPQSTYHALTRLSTTGFDPYGAGDDSDPLLARPSQPVPSSLLPTSSDDEPPSDGLLVRYARTDDMKDRKSASESAFYRRYGRGAGKERGRPAVGVKKGLESYDGEWPAYEDEEGGEEVVERRELLDDDDDKHVERKGHAHMDELEVNKRSRDLLESEGDGARTRRPAMDLVDAEEEQRPRSRRRLIDRVDLEPSNDLERGDDDDDDDDKPPFVRRTDVRELSPVRTHRLRGWDDDDEGPSRPSALGRSLLDRLDRDERPRRGGREWDRSASPADVVVRRERGRYEEGSARSGGRGPGGGKGRGSGERRERKGADELDRELDEFLGRA